jgi:hypothetical protein
MNIMKIEHETFDFHGVFICRCLPAGDSRRYDKEFWKELLGGKEKRSKEQNLKELGF